MTAETMTVGEALIACLEKAGVDTVFGIPGVHTIELYRGLAASRIRHITPRHEQGAAFMADGYARASGKPGVCLLITGPGFTNAITAMAQARADSIPMLVITGVNATTSLGKGRGHLHELPDQAALARTIVLKSHTITDPADLVRVMTEAFEVMTHGRPGPVHVEIPLDVMAMPASADGFDPPDRTPPTIRDADLEAAAAICRDAAKPLILAGGGARRAGDAVCRLAERLDAPVITTANARGLMHGHPLDLHASPSLKCIRAVIMASDCVVALGTEFGPTDYDMYENGGFALSGALIRADIDTAQLARGPTARVSVEGDAGAFAEALAARLEPKTCDGAARADAARNAAWREIGPRYRNHCSLAQRIWQSLPEATLVGDSTQTVYAGNLCLDAPRPGAWFNSSTGFGTLGYGAPAAVGAALAGPGRPVVSISGDGGLQFTLAELGSAADCGADVAFMVWNNDGYGEIEDSMLRAGIEPVGVRPSAPDFCTVARAYGLPAERVGTMDAALDALTRLPRPCLIECDGRQDDVFFAATPET